MKGNAMKTPTTDRWKYRRNQYKPRHQEHEVGWYALAAAVVRQAVEDWLDADKLENGVIRFSNTGIGSPARTKREIVRFFHSQWYGTLCDIDPHRILRKLGAE